MIQSTGITRKVDELGRVVLPIDVRHALGIEEKDALEILLDEENGRIILQRGCRACLKCRSAEHLKELKPGFYLCDACIQELK